MSGQFLVTNRKELTEFERGKIIALSEKEQSVRKISNDLGYPKSTVQDTISLQT
ncbi:306_t:CDS:2 [Entrophospora sp. SA101]|nr:306_t:CDS:2 [Entrophospora sp. SA101]